MKNILENGDIILFGGSNGFMGKTIRYFDNAEFTHIGIIHFVGFLPYVLDMWKKGIELVPLSKRITIYPKQSVLRFEASETHQALSISELFEKWFVEEKINYDYTLLPRIAIAKKLKIDFLAWGKDRDFICSELVQEYANKFTNNYKGIKLITPEDFVRYKPEKWELIEINTNKHEILKS